MLSLITLPNNFTASTTGIMSTLFSDLSPVLILVFGVLLGALVIDIVVGALHRK